MGNVNYKLLFTKTRPKLLCISELAYKVSVEYRLFKTTNYLCEVLFVLDQEYYDLLHMIFLKACSQVLASDFNTKLHIELECDTIKHLDILDKTQTLVIADYLP